MLCQKTVSDEANVSWYLHSYLDKWIQEFQEEEEFSAANGGQQRHPKRNKGKGNTIPGCPYSITFGQRRRYRQQEVVLKFLMIGIRVSSLNPIGSTMRKRKG